VCRVKGMGIDEKKLKQNINKNEKSKDVATYFILMKKLVKSG
jgi:phage anti-repressor protein